MNSDNINNTVNKESDTAEDQSINTADKPSEEESQEEAVNDQENGNDSPDIVLVRKKFDEVLTKHISRLLEIETLDASLSFNLSTISCLLLLVERENEIKDAPDSPPERYTREAFLDAIAELGMEINDDLLVSFKSLAQHGYVAINDDNRYLTQISSFAMVNFLNNLFPGMPGMNFVGFILQMIDEVISGRKELKQAIDAFDQTLIAKGIPLSEQGLKAEEKESVKETISKASENVAETGIDSTKISDNQKKEYSDKLSKLRSLTDSKVSKSSFLSVTDKWKEKEKLKEVFSQGDKEEELDKAEKEAAEKEAREAEEKAAQITALEEEIKAREADIKAAEIAAREAELKAKEAEIKAREAEIEAQKSEIQPDEASTEIQAPPPDSKVEIDDQVNIENQINQFQQTLATACPLCAEGKIFSQATEKGQDYYSCSNEKCGFVSWSRPYNFECPLCKNLFLVEFLNDGQPGLKCPRDTCSYRQDSVAPPTLENKPDNSSGKPKRRRKVVRKRRR